MELQDKEVITVEHKKISGRFDQTCVWWKKPIPEGQNAMEVLDEMTAQLDKKLAAQSTTIKTETTNNKIENGVCSKCNSTINVRKSAKGNLYCTCWYK